MKKLLWVACASGIGWLMGPQGNVEGQALVDPGTQGPPSAEAKPVRPRSALQAGIDWYKKAEYEQADMCLRQAEQGQAQLSDEDKTLLDKWLKQNTEALRSRRTGQAQIQQADQAMHMGQTADAEALLKTLKTNKYLSAKDQQMVAGMSEQLKQKSGRKSLFGGSESATKKDPDALLADARKALEQKDYDKAVMLAHESEKAGYKSVFPWSDHPSKVIAACEAAKPKQSAMPAGDKAAQCRGLLQQAHLAVQAGDTVKARRFLQQAEDLKVNVPVFEEYTPEKVRNEIVRAENASVKPSVVPVKAEMPVSSAPSSDPKAMVKEARMCVDKGDLDRAEDLAKRARLTPGTKWGLFDDTPEKVLEEVVKAREVQNSAKAAELLAEARKKMEASQLDEAEKLCHQSMALRSSYPVWHQGDKPEKLLKDIAAKRRLASKPLLPPISEPVAQKPTAPPPAPYMPANPVTPPSTVTPPPMVASVTPPVMTAPSNNGPPRLEANPQQDQMLQARKQEEARNLCVQARLCLNRGEYAAAAQYANQAKGLNVQVRVGLDDNPEDILRAVQSVQNSAFAKEQQMVASSEAARQQALRYMGEARMFQKELRLIEALQAAQAATKVGATFAPGEDTPEAVLADLQQAAKAQYDTYYRAAQNLINAGKYVEAEEYLLYVQKLSACYVLDGQAVVQQLAQVKRLANSGAPEHAVQLSGEGQQLIANARRELQRGDLVQARKLAESAYSGPYGVKAEANKLLGELDDAEYQAALKRAKTAFEIGRRHYIRKEYDLAAGYLANIDLKLLDDHSRQMCQEMLASRFINGQQDRTPLPVEPDAVKPAVANVPQLPDTTQSPLPSVPVQARPAEWTQPNAVANNNVEPQPATDKKPAGGSSLIDEVRMRQMVELQRLRDMKLTAEKQANQLAGMNKLNDAIAVLENGVKTLKTSGLEAEQIGPMQRQLEARIKQLTVMREQQDISRLADDEKQAKNKVAMTRYLDAENKKQKVADLMKQYKVLYNDGKYVEAEAVALKAHEINPDDPAVDAAASMAQIKKAVLNDKYLKDAQQKGIVDASQQAFKAAVPIPGENENHFTYGPDWQSMNERRKGKPTWLPTKKPTKEDQDVTRALNSTVSVDFKDKPLGEVLNQLREMAKVNIVPDQVSLQTDNVSLDMPVTLRLDKVALKTALKVLLNNARLSYVVNDGVLLVTTPAGARGKVETRIFPVADLIVPVDNMANIADGKIKGNDTNKAVNEMMASMGSSNFQVSVSAPPGASGYVPGGGQQTTAKGRQAGQTMEEQLMKLVIDTIEPQSWDLMGGSGHIEYYGLNMTMVVSQTPDIQEQVQLLLDRLRDLQNLQVTVEVRFLTLSEDFYEFIGMDFDINILSKERKFQREVVASAFAPAGQVNAPSEHNVVVGLTPQGGITQDLNVPIDASSFNNSLPPFGNFPNSPGQNGGLSMGVAFLSDIEVFMVMEAAQGDRRSSLLTAPKITLFNGQQAAITTNRVQPYVATVITIPGNFGGAPGQFPVIQNAVSQTSLAVQAVVSADRRYVQLTLNPIIQRTRLDATTTFTFTSGNPFSGTTTIQEPITDTLALGTTVSVPDGGTILLGGFKNLNEGRNEFGPPILSKIPYINRLFSNVGYGREEQSLLFMVTPHIIIPEEEEERLGATFAF